MEPTPQKQGINLPTAIVIAALLIAGAIVWNKPAQVIPGAQQKAPENVLAPVTSEDHVLGNENAQVFIVEYSDTACPFCKLFHVTMKKIMESYGKQGNVAWVYRHFPLDKPNAEGFILHPNAGREAQALECAADIGGNEAFWTYTNRLYDITPSVTSQSPQGLDQTQLYKIAEFTGLDAAKFKTCLDSGKFKEKVEESYLEGVNAGVAGTPYSFIITRSGKKAPINGARSYNEVKAAIDAMLAQEN
ncbi:MAG: DsbA family protein [Candidatus Taylorbacteria bacterium]|nr:DsbA family protein [Candidatus Taylorbacteria bacterium]